MSKLNTELVLFFRLLSSDEPDEEVILRYMHDDPTLCSLCPLENGKYPLHLAIENSLSMKVIHKMIEYYPDACRIRNDDGDLLLQVLIHNKTRFEVIDAVIDAFPEAARSMGGFKVLPIFLECCYQCRFEVIMKLYDAYPDALSTQDEYGDFPLFAALLNDKSTPDLISFFIDRYPNSARMKSDNIYLPLHIECKNHCRYDIVKLLLDIYPEAISIAGRGGNLPLHIALSKEDSVYDVVMHLIKSFPDAIRTKNDADSLPIHIECEHHCRYDIVIKLLEYYPDSIRIYDANHNLPLHRALSCNDYHIFDVIWHLIGLYEDAARMKNGSDNYPLHIECFTSRRHVIIKKLVEIYPDATKIRDSSNNLPLHSICISPSVDISSCTAATIFLINQYKDAVHMKNCNDNLALHVECGYQCRYEVIRILLDIYPAAVHIPASDGNLPLYLAVQNEAASLDVIRCIIKGDAAMVKVRDNNGYLPLYFIVKIYIRKYYDMDDDYLQRRREAMIKYLLRLYPESIVNTDEESLIHTLGYLSYRPYRMVLHFALHVLPSHSYHIQKYHDLNWENRLPLLHLLLQLSVSYNHNNKQPSIDNSMVYGYDDAMKYNVLMRMVRLTGGRAAVSHVDGYSSSSKDRSIVAYDWLVGDDIGQHLLRAVIGYL